MKRWQEIPEATVIAIANAVEAHGGDFTDVEDLLDVWQRVTRVNGERAERIRVQAAGGMFRYEGVEGER